MASPAASATPSVPPLACKPPVVAPASSPGPGTPGSVTSKEWVIPPRPKPGRKPATDTPPTKRKAQNRAAQRAFRERRAARVGELEEQIKQIEEKNEIHVTDLKNQIANLSHELERSRHEISWWRDRCHALEKEIGAGKRAKDSLVKSVRQSNEDPTIFGDQMSLSPRPQMRNAQTNRQSSGENDQNTSSSNEAEDVPLGCSRCSLAHCQCIEDAFAISGVETGAQDSSRQHQLSEPKVKAEPEEMEIDFTSRFSAFHTQNDESSISSPAVDPCGFCQDGTPCICAEMAAQEEQRQKQSRRLSFDSRNRLAPIQNISQFTPPPSDSDARSEVTLPPISQTTNLCANGPGTCAQCQADPRSTLFCKSLAAARSATSNSGCCGGKGPGGGCCQSRNPSANHASGSNGTTPLTLSCADAFTTLSRHPNFSRASDEIDSWLPKLYTLPEPHGPSVSSRPTMEVEAASVMGVLRYFDRRFADK